MITRRELLIVLVTSMGFGPLKAIAQQLAARVYRIGFLGMGSASQYAHRIDALRAGLRDFGYVEGKNITLDYQWADGNNDHLPQLAEALIRVPVDVLVTHTTSGTRAAQKASANVPIVVTDVPDAVSAGLVASLARPGGNITGSSFMGPELNVKRLEMVKEMLPRMRRVGMLVNPTSPPLTIIRKEMEIASKAMKVELQEFALTQSAEFKQIFMEIARRRVDALLVVEHPVFTVNTRIIANLAVENRLPLAGFSEFAEAGGLLGYGVNFAELYRRAAYFIDRILKGANPGELPIEQPTKFELIINVKTAKILGLKIPPSLLLRAERVIE